MGRGLAGDWQYPYATMAAWLRRIGSPGFCGDHYPTGTAWGWRRTGCFVMMVGALALSLLAILFAVVAALV